MSLISDPWDDQDVEVQKLENRIQNIRTVQHRSHSQWSDSSTTNRPVMAPVEVTPTVRIMKRDNSNNLKDRSSSNNEIPNQTLAEKERAYAEARKRILGIPDEPTNDQKTEEKQARDNSYSHGAKQNGHRQSNNTRGGGGGGSRGGRSRNKGNSNSYNQGNKTTTTTTGTQQPTGYTQFDRWPDKKEARQGTTKPTRGKNGYRARKGKSIDEKSSPDT